MATEQEQKAYLIGEHPDFGQRFEESAEITGVLYKRTGLGNLSRLYRIVYKDGTESLVHADATTDFAVYSEDAIAQKLVPLIAHYKRELNQRGGGDKVKEIYEEIKRLATPRLLIDFLEQLNNK